MSNASLTFQDSTISRKKSAANTVYLVVINKGANVIKKGKKIRVESNFHNTACRIEALCDADDGGDYYMLLILALQEFSDRRTSLDRGLIRQYQRIKRKLCGCTDCHCGFTIR